MKAYKGIKAVKKDVDLEQILHLRKENNLAYFDFIEYFVSAVIGKLRYKQNCCDALLSQYASVSDEAFAILIFENNLDAWVDMGLRKDTSGTQVPRKYTNGGNSKGELGSSQHNKGWSEQGLKRFNELFDQVKMNRLTSEAIVFEENFRKYCEDKLSSKKKKMKLFIQDSFAVRHELWSDNEDGKIAKTNDADGPPPKKSKVYFDGVSMYGSGGRMTKIESDSNLDQNSDNETEDEGDLPNFDETIAV